MVREQRFGPITEEPRLGVRLWRSLAGAGLALALAFAAAHFYAPPHLNGGARQSPWFELDVCFALASSLLSLGVAVYAGRIFEPSRPFARVIGRSLAWIALTLVLALSWRSSVALSALLIGPSHAFLALRLASLWRVWRTEVLWRRRR